MVLQAVLVFLFLGITTVQGATINQPVGSFSLPNSHHKKKTLKEYRGKIVFINFWASWCGPCQQELPELNRLAEEYKKKNMAVLTINVDQDPLAGKALLNKLDLNHPAFETYWDDTSKTVSAFDIEAMPTSVLLDAKGTIRFIHSGFHPTDPNQWRKELNQLIF